MGIHLFIYFLRKVGYFIYFFIFFKEGWVFHLFFLASGYRMAFFFFLIFFWNFFQGLKIFLGIFIRGCEFKRIYILVTKLTTFLYIYFKGCVNYFSRVVLIILKVLNKSSNSHTLVFIWTNFSNSWKKRVETAYIVCSDDAFISNYLLFSVIFLWKLKRTICCFQ